MIRHSWKRMLKLTRLTILILVGFVLLFWGIAVLPVFATGLNGDTTYTDGPNVCAKCHPNQFNQWLNHGHSRKLAGGAIVGTLDGKWGVTADARSMGIPLPDHDTDVYNWNNILMVIGSSKHWKTRYMDLNGFIITKGGKNQYNWETGTFSDYEKDTVKKFDCGPCHTSGYRKEGSFGVAGIVGDFAHINITCENEYCHGAGATHAASPSKANIIASPTAAAKCGGCHQRGSDPNVIPADAGFIRHQEQYQEFLQSPHKSFDCVTCHDQHVGRAKGIKVATGQSEICATCHSSQVSEYKDSKMQKAGVKCQDCHMGKAGKSAVKNGPYEGDVWSHLFRVNSAADYTMFSADGKTAKDALSLEFACFRCHADASKATFAAIGTTGTAYHTIGK